MIRIIVVGKFRNGYVKEGFDDYLKRLRPFTRAEVIELKADNSSGEIRRCLESEGERALSIIKDDCLILLDKDGKQFSSEQFSDELKKAELSNKRITFVIGSSYGFSGRLMSRADKVISLSRMTFPHQLVRLIFIEQLYRAYTIMNNIGYHK